MANSPLSKAGQSVWSRKIVPLQASPKSTGSTTEAPALQKSCSLLPRNGSTNGLGKGAFGQSLFGSSSLLRSKRQSQVQPLAESTAPAVVTSTASAEALPATNPTRTFVISGNPESANLDVLREELQARGLVEREYDPEIMDFDLKWGPRSKVDYRVLSPSQLVNHFECDAELTTKSGLAENLQAACSPADSRHFYPQCFHLSTAAQIQEFSIQFKFSKASCVLKAWLGHVDAEKCPGETFQEGVVRTALAAVKRRLEDIDTQLDEEQNEGEQVDFVVKRREWEILQAADFERPQQNSAFDEIEQERARKKLAQQQNKAFVEQYDQKLKQIADQAKAKQTQNRRRRPILHVVDTELESDRTLEMALGEEEEKEIQEEEKDEEEASEALSGPALVEVVRDVIETLRQHPQYNLNVRNIWIMKPANSLRGQGITVENDLDRIIKQARNRTSSYVCQKYIENPLLIGGTRKHDIRQWVLVTSVDPLTVYFYSECYVRVAANEYSLDDFGDRFKHLTHTIIMKHHPNFDPDDEDWRCQWTQERYRRLLMDKSGYDVWNEKVLPAMKHTVISSLLSVTEALSRPETSCSSFQVLGYDFLVDDQFNVWLLEVNDIPMLHASGPVTERLCDTCLRDAIGIVLDGPPADRSRATKAGAQRFELLHHGPQMPKLPPLKGAGHELVLEGKKRSVPKRAPSSMQSPSSPGGHVRLSAQRRQELQDLVDRRRQREDKEHQKRERQLRLRHLLAKKMLGGDMAVSSPCLKTLKEHSPTSAERIKAARPADGETTPGGPLAAPETAG